MRDNDVENIDCMEGLATYPDKFFDWAIVDPPYGIGAAKMAYTRETNRSIVQKNGSSLRIKKNAYSQLDWDSTPPPQEYFDELVRISKNQIIFGIEYFDWTGVGPGRIKWNKGFAEKVSFKGYEVAYCSAIDETIEIDLLWAGMQQAKSLLEPMTSQGNKKLNEKRIHPTHKPMLLYKKLYQMFLKPGDKIIDTHLGGGSSRLVAWDEGYYFKGYEINKEYFDKHNERFNRHVNTVFSFLEYYV
jgi:site-specific DNA-methyltransferase (adenine-specific)